MRRDFSPADFDDVSLLLLDAIAAEGITPPVVSEFGEMLQRTAGDLGHDADLYAAARNYTFCSARIAAALVTEARDQIALCPLSIALYQQHTRSETVTVVWQRSAASTAGQAADILRMRIVERIAKTLR